MMADWSYHGSLLGQGHDLWGRDSDRPRVDGDRGLLSGCHRSHWKHIKNTSCTSTLFSHLYSSQKVQNSTYISSIPSKSLNKTPDKIILFGWHTLHFIFLYISVPWPCLYLLRPNTYSFPKYCKLLSEICLHWHIFYLSCITKQF